MLDAGKQIPEERGSAEGSGESTWATTDRNF
jgi:hypothetical protein